jgi:hypothetical protein
MVFFPIEGFAGPLKTTSNLYLPSQEAANFSWRMNAESLLRRVSPKLERW